MYLPYATERYGGEWIPLHYENLIRDPEHIELLLIKKDGESVAGEVLCYKKGNVFLRCIGVKPGNPGLVKAGVIQAIYYFESHYLKDKGNKKIVFGGSRTFFRDGVLAFKKKWGLRITQRGLSVMRLYPLRDSRGLRSFLIHNSFIAIDGKDLVAALFVDWPWAFTETDIKAFSGYHWPGLKRVVVYRFGDGPTPPEQRAYADHVIDLRSANTLFSSYD
jgi:hypothetical protein